MNKMSREYSQIARPSPSQTSELIDRRTLIKATGASVVAGLVGVAQAGRTTEAAQAVPTTRPGGVARDDLIVRKIPKGEDVLPAIGLGTFMTFDLLPGARRDDLLEVTRRFWAAGGRVFDTSPLYGMAEVNVGQFASALSINDKMFVSNKLWATGEFLADDRQGEDSLRLSRERLWRDKIDLMLCHSLVNVDIMVPLMHAWKKEGRIRYLGVTHYELPYFEALAQWVEKGNLDVVQVHYSIATRQAEERIIPAAADRGTAVAVNMPLEKARLHKLVEGRPLPDFAKEFGATTWSSFFLKWVISNPAVTMALPATTNPDHVVENVAAMRGPLPDSAMRKRMVAYMETVPGFATLAAMPWYPGKTFRGVIALGQAAIRGRG
jgi:diketogulonate reductase-like aldo/keto reductase